MVLKCLRKIEAQDLPGPPQASKTVVRVLQRSTAKVHCKGPPHSPCAWMMGATQAFINSMNQTPPSSLAHIDTVKNYEDLLGFAPAYQEWAVANCGDVRALTEATPAKNTKNLSVQAKEALSTKAQEAAFCEYRAARSLAVESYRSSISEFVNSVRGPDVSFESYITKF